MKYLTAISMVVVIILLLGIHFERRWNDIQTLRLNCKDSEIEYWKQKYMSASIIPVKRYEDLIREIREPYRKHDREMRGE